VLAQPTFSNITFSPHASPFVGETGVSFVITGSGFAGGVTAVFSDTYLSTWTSATTSHTNTTVSGTLDIPFAVLGSELTLTTPGGEASTPLTFPAAPVPTTDNQGIWWLGTVTSAPNQQYFEATDVFVTGRTGSDSTVTWSAVDPNGNTNAYSSFQCTAADGTCSTAILWLNGSPGAGIAGCATLQVTAAWTNQTAGALDTVTSSPLFIYVDQPNYLLLQGVVDHAWQEGPQPFPPGYESENTLLAVSSCGQAMPGLWAVEAFSGNSSQCGSPSPIWTVSPPPNPKGPFLTGGGGAFIDTVGFWCTGCTPQATIPGPLQSPPIPLSTQVNSWFTQTWYFGSNNVTQGANGGQYWAGEGWPVTPDMQVRYTDNGRDPFTAPTCQ
jgi:hypothetical protein